MSTETTLNAGEISVLVVRKDIKNLHLAVYPPDGRVRVSAPEAMPEDAIRLAVVKRLGWIRRQQREILSALRQSPREMVAGESHYLFGQRYLLQIKPATGRASVDLVRQRQLTLNSKPDADLHLRLDALDRFYRQELTSYLDPLLAEWSQRLGVGDVDLAFKEMRTRWGTCSASRRVVTLNPQLAKQPRECIEYILVHELAHLIEHTHGPAFVALMDTHMPDWRARNARLNAGLLTVDCHQH